MSSLLGSSTEVWQDVGIAVAVFLATLIATLWLRHFVYRRVQKWAVAVDWPGHQVLQDATRLASVLWCILVSSALALVVSPVPSQWKSPAANGLWTLLALSLTVSGVRLIEQLILLYGDRLKAPQRAIVVSRSAAKAAIYVVAILVILDIWGVPTTPVIILIAIMAAVAILAGRESVPNLLAGYQLSATGEIKVGDYLRLESGEEGYVRAMDWGATKIQANDESVIIIPNRKLTQSTVVNLGQPVKKAREAFRFFEREHLKELTGLRASTVRELAHVLKTVPDSVVYYHTHHFLEEHHFLNPEPASDFAIWVGDTLGDEVLGEKLANIDAFEFPTLEALRERTVNVIEGHLLAGGDSRRAPDGREFHFVRSVSVVMPTPYRARDLREFVEALRKLSLGSLYFHIFESRLRLGRPTNDFSVWFEGSLDEHELADQVARFDPYNHTLEDTRSLLILLIEKRLRQGSRTTSP